MACLMNCRICGYGVVDKHTCEECEGEIVRRCLSGESFNEEAVRKAVQKNREHRNIQDSKQDIRFENSERDNWKKYRDKMESLQSIIDKAITQAQKYKNNTEINNIINILKKA